MKLAYLSSSTLPSTAANSVHVMKMCQAFGAIGHQVTLIAPDKPSDLPTVSDLYAFYGVQPCFDVSKLVWANIKGRAYLYGVLAGWRARQLKADLAFGRNLTACVAACMLGLPTIFESHAPIEDSGRVATFLFKRLIRNRKFQSLVVITHSLADYYLQRYPELAGKIQVAADGADPVGPDVRPAVFNHEAAERLQVGYVGHLYQGRGIDVIEAMAQRLPWADFHVVGGTPVDIEACRGRVNGLSNFFVHGYMSPVQAERYRLACDVLLAPYQESVSVSGNTGNTVQWMSPLKVFEYMAAGKAIICSDIPVLREVLEDGRNAVLCPPAVIDNWTSALQSLRDDPALMHSLGRAALADFDAQYSWFSRAGNILRSYPSAR
ncbi:glycosyltransferase family 4 protein [Pseudomonas sichuanensis]|uniref:glycosyltransferase family 4 protein n=1 Tax=Pseudomonas TaxID=286 RepID=UPI0036E011B1